MYTSAASLQHGQLWGTLTWRPGMAEQGAGTTDRKG